MVRNPLKKTEEVKEDPKPAEVKAETGVQVIERPINISLLNDKLNYIIGILTKIAKAAEIDISEQ